MRHSIWLIALALGISLFGHLWLYTAYLFRLSFSFTVVVAGCLILIAMLCLLMLRFFCRHWFAYATPPEWIQQIILQLSRGLKIKPPALYTLSTQGINAFALGDGRASGVVFVHGQMLAHLTQDEVESVLAHELAHLSSGHAMLMTFLQGMTAPLIAPIAAGAGFFMSLLFGIRGFRQHFIQVYHMLNILLFPLTTVLIALVMRQWEFAADRRAARLVGKTKYIAALQCLHGSFFQHPDLLNLSAGKPGSDSEQWALSHPSLKQRIHALREVG